MTLACKDGLMEKGSTKVFKRVTLNYYSENLDGKYGILRRKPKHILVFGRIYSISVKSMTVN